MSAHVVSSRSDIFPIEATRSGARASSRLALLDGARLLAAIGIIWAHAATSEAGLLLYPIGTFGVPFYICVALLFMTRSLTREPKLPLAHYITSRISRVYVPFLFWTVVYVMLAQAKMIVNEHRIELPTWNVLYAGGQQHLWFLPYLMVATILGAILVRALEGRTRTSRIVVAALVLAGAAACWWQEPAWIATRAPHGDLEFFRFGFRAIPTVCFGLALALSTCMHGRLPRTTRLMAFGGAVLLGLSLLLQSAYSPDIKLLRSCAGFGILLIALWPAVVPAIERLGSLGRHSYGIYLSHVLFIRIVVLWIEREGIPRSIWLDLATFGFALTASMGLSILLSKSKYTRWALGE